MLGDVDSVKMKQNASSTSSITLFSKAYNELGGVQSKNGFFFPFNSIFL